MGKEIRFTKEQAEAAGQRLRQMMDLRKMEPVELAGRMGVSTAHISGMTVHGRGSLAAWSKACSILQVSMDYVVSGQFPLSDPQWVKKVLLPALNSAPVK